MAAEETKVAAEETETPKEKGNNYGSGDRWTCNQCGMSNSISSWQCMACFSSMKKSIQKDRIQKNRKKQKENKVYAKRQAKRAELRKKQGSASTSATPKNDDNDGDEAKNSKDDENKETSENNKDKKTKTKPEYILSDNIPETMRALVKETEGKGYKLKTDYPVPTPKEDELLIRSFSVAICGSDNILYDWSKEAQTIAKLPFIPGHEAAGLIVGVGRDCRFRIGERVAIENHFYCGECYQCLNGRKDICANLQQFGHGKGTIYGGCCEYYVVKQKYAYRLKADISWRDAALLEPLGVAHNACEQADLNVVGVNKDKIQKETLLVVGCGAIGCMVVGVAKTMNVTGKIIAIDVVQDKLDIAKKMGADIVFNPLSLKDKSLKEKILELTDGVGVGRIIECSGHAKTISQIFGCLRKGGAVTLVGLPKEPLVINNPLQDIIFKSIQIRTVHGRRIFKTWNKTEKLVANKKIILDPLVSCTVPLSKFEDAYSRLKSGKALKVVFDLTK